MKLPEIKYTQPVQSLGRRSPGAEAAAAGAMGKVLAQALSQGMGLAKDIYRNEAAKEFTVEQGELKKDLTDLGIQLTSKSAFDPDEIPDYVDYKDTEQVLINGVAEEEFRDSIPAEEVRLQWYQGAVKELETKYKDRSKIGLAEDRLIASLRNDLGPAGYAAIAKFNLKELIDGQNAAIGTAVDDAVSNQDMQQVDQVLMRAKAAGIYNRAEVKQTRDKALQDIDRNLYMDDIQLAESASQLDNIYDQLTLGKSQVREGKKTTMSYEQRNHLYGLIEGQKTAILKERSLIYDRTGQQGVRLVIADKLTDEWIDVQLKYDKIDDATARSLLSLRASGDKQTDPAKLSRHKVLIKSILYPAEGDSVAAGAQALRADFLEQARVGDLTGEELDILYTDIDQTEKTITATPVYKQTTQLIKSFVGIPDIWSGDEKDPRTWAYNSFTSALFQYVDTAGAEADPLTFFHEHKAAFDPNVFASSGDRRFLTIYPEYEPSSWSAPSTSDGGNTIYEGAPLDRDKITAQMYQQYIDGDLSYDELVFRWTELVGRPPTTSDYSEIFQ